MRRLWVRKQYDSFGELTRLVQLELQIYNGGNAGDEPDDEGPCNDKELELNMYCR